MKKAPEAFRTISEVSEILETPAHVLRFWESKFYQIRPVKRAGGRRYYRPDDVALINGIRILLQEQGMTIRGVQRVLQEQGSKHVAGLGGVLPLGDPGEVIDEVDVTLPDAAARDGVAEAADAVHPQSEIPFSDTERSEDMAARPDHASPAADPEHAPAARDRADVASVSVPESREAAETPNPPQGDTQEAEAVDDRAVMPEPDPARATGDNKGKAPVDDTAPIAAEVSEGSTDASEVEEPLMTESETPPSVAAAAAMELPVMEDSPEPEAPETGRPLMPASPPRVPSLEASDHAADDAEIRLAKRLRDMPRGGLGRKRDAVDLMARRIDALLERMSEASGAGRW